MTKKHPYKKIVLPNKLTVLLYQMKSVMTVFAILYVRVGAVYEPNKLRGISHFTEHVAFLGTKKYPTPLAISQEVQRLGARYNGWCDRFRTEYWTSLPYTNISAGIDLLYQLTFEPLTKKSDVAKEKGVILSEYNDFWHDPDKRFNHESWRKRFKQRKHPYSYDAIGIPETIKTINQEKILYWMNKYYRPANMILSTAGKVDESLILKVIKNSFGKRKAGVKRKEPKFNTKDYSNFNIYYQKESRPQIRFIVTFPAFGQQEAGRPKRMRLNLLEYIFGGGPASRLFQRLREKERFAYSVGSSINLHTWMGAFIIWGSVPVEKLEQTMKIIREETDKLVDKGVTEKEIELAKNYLSASALMKFDNPESIAIYLAGQVFDDEKVWFPEDYIRQANKIKKEQLDKLAKEIIDYSKVNISFLGRVPDKTLKEAVKVFKQ